MQGTDKGEVDLRGNLDSGISEENPKAEPPCGSVRPLDDVYMLPGRATVGQKMEGKYYGRDD